MIIKINNDKGKNDFQVKLIKRSYRIRGKVPRAQMKKIAKFLAPKIKIMEEIKGDELRDPKNRAAEIILMTIMLAYSAIKIKANVPPLYSILNPDTSSDSPSARSNGVRLVSANIEIIQIISKIGKSIMGHAILKLFIFVKSNDRYNKGIGSRIKIILTS